MISGNVGEWSEVYALLKVIADKELSSGDGELRKLSNAALPIIRVLREESDGTYQYEIDQDIVVITGADNVFRFPIIEFKKHAEFLLSKLINLKDKSSKIVIPEIESFINGFNCRKLKAKSSKKTDIKIVIHDAITGVSPELGFSIKSRLNNPSTLLNSGETTNFIFRICGDQLTPELVEDINSIKSKSKIKDRIKRLYAIGRSLQFVRLNNQTFSNNLMLIDSALPRLLSEIVFSFYSSSGKKTLSDQIIDISENNPLNFDMSASHPFYSYKVKRLLSDIALGMMPSRVWTGKLDATGGYLVIREDGEVLAYHIYNRNDFEDYLLNNTKLETADTKKHKFGSVYEENSEQFFKLNLQIRFIK